MADIRQSSSSEPSKANFDAESVAGDLWMRQNYQAIHLELGLDEAHAFIQSAEGVGLIIERSEAEPARSGSKT
jgi:hypothetical protein